MGKHVREKRENWRQADIKHPVTLMIRPSFFSVQNDEPAKREEFAMCNQ